MNPTLIKLAAMMCLAAAATEDEVLAAVAALKAKADGADALQGEVAALKAKVMDPTKFVPVEVANELKVQVAALTSRVNEREVEDEIAAAIAEGKLATPAEQAYARTIGKADVAQLKAYIAASPAIAALKGTQTGGKKPAPASGDGELTEDQLAVCRTLGLEPDEYKKALTEQRAAA